MLMKRDMDLLRRIMLYLEWHLRAISNVCTLPYRAERIPSISEWEI